MIAGLVVIGLFDVALQYLRTYALSQPHRRRTRPAPVRPSPAPTDGLFRDASRGADRREDEGARDDPQLSDRTGAVLGDRPGFHLCLLRGDVRLFNAPDVHRSARPSRLSPDRVP